MEIVVSSSFPPRSAALLLLALAALTACSGGSPVLMPAVLSEPAAEPSAPPEPAAHPAPTLRVAGSAPEEPAPLPPFDCLRGTELRLGDKRYCLYLDATPWPAAEQRCNEHGGHLATLGSLAEEQALFQTLGTPPGVPNFWIGLAEPREGRWLWSNGQRVAFFAWNAGEPNNAGGSENCGEWLFPTGRWNDLDCAIDHPFLCENKLASPKARPPACKGRSFTLGESAYCLHETDASDWEKAQRACSSAGGTLAVVETAAENQGIAAALGARPVQVSGSVWLGLSDRAHEGSFTWASGAPLSHTAFRAGEPNNAGEEDCVEWSPGDGKWNDLPCSSSLPSLCEAPSLAGSLSWMGMADDHVGESNSFVPNGKPDGHFRFVLPRGGLVTWISVSSVNRFGNPEGGQFWHTADPTKWVIGVLRNGQTMRASLGMPVGEVGAGEALDLHCSDSGFFTPGQLFAVEVMFADGTAIKRVVAVPPR
jgi:hypothetical protein